MWLFTKIGFYSIVQHHDAPNHFLVRARCHQDLKNLKKEVPALGKRKIHKNYDRDYRFRLFITAQELISIMFKLANLIDYTNFKNEVKKRKDQQSKLPYLGDVWWSMFDYQMNMEEGKLKKHFLDDIKPKSNKYLIKHY